MKQHKTSLRLFAENSAVSFSMVLLLGVLNYILKRSLALTLPEEDFGLLYSVISIVLMLMGFLDLGLGEAMGILISRSHTAGDTDQSKKLFTCFLYFRMVMAGICFGGLAAASPWLKVSFFGYDGPVLYIVGLLALIVALGLESAMLQGLAAIQSFATRYGIENFKIAILFAVSYLFVPKFGLGVMVIAWPLVTLLAAGIGFLYLRYHKVATLSFFQDEHFLELRSVLSLSMWIAVSRAGMSAMGYMDTVCLTWLTDLESVAVYNVAVAINQIAYSLMVLPLVLTPTVSILWDNRDYAQIKRIMRHIISFCLIMLPAVVVIGIFGAGKIITVMFAAKFAGGASSLVWLWVGTIFLIIGSVCTRTLNAGHEQRSSAIIVLVCVAIYFALNVLLIPRFGSAGAAAAACCSYLLMASWAAVKLLCVLKSRMTGDVKT